MAHQFIIYTYGNLPVLQNILMSISGFFAGGFIKNMFYLGLLLSLTIYAMQMAGLLSTGSGTAGFDVKYFFRIFIIIGVLINTTVSGVILIDTSDNQRVPIENAHIPFGLVFIQSLTSTLFYDLTMAYQKYFEVDSQDVTYTKSGMAFGSNFVANLPRISSGDPIFDKNLGEFYSNCAIPIIYQTGGLNNFVSSGNLLNDVANVFSTNAVANSRFVQQSDATGKVNIISCNQALNDLNTYWSNNSTTFSNNVATASGFSGNITQFLASAGQSSGDLLGITGSATDTLKQAISMNAIYKAINSGATQVNNTALANAAYDAMQFEQYAANGELSGEQAARVIPAIKTYAESLTYMLYPIVIFFALLIGGFKPVKIYLSIIATINAMPFMYDILNSLTYEYAKLHTSGLGSYNLLNAASMYSFNANVVAVSNYLAMAVPMISYLLITGATNSIISVMGHATDTARSAAGAVASEEARGNMSIGNLSQDNVSMSNFASNSLNDRLTANTGAASINQMLSSGSSLNTMGSGEQFLNQSTSNLRNHQSISDAFQQQVSQSYHKALAEQSQSSTGLRNALSNLESSSNGLSSNEQKSAYASITSEIRGSIGAGVKVDGGVIGKLAKLGGVGADVNAAGSLGATSQSQDMHNINASKNNEFRTGISKTMEAVNDYNSSVSKSQSLATDLSQAQTMGSQTVRNLDTAISRDALREFGTPDKAEKMLEGDTPTSQNWIKQKVENYSAQRGHLEAPSTEAHANNFNTTKIESTLGHKGNVQQINQNASKNQLEIDHQNSDKIFTQGFSGANSLNPRGGAVSNTGKRLLEKAEKVVNKGEQAVNAVEKYLE